MFTHIKNKSARIIVALMVTLFLAGAPIAVSNAHAAGGSGGSGGSVVTGD
ncbi:MAG: hypothetical protein AAGD96_31450 [Chloroflexota bacterium]